MSIIKTTADIVNQVNWFGLDVRERLVLKTMIDLSFTTRLVKISELSVILSKDFTITSIAAYLIKLREKGFVDRHRIDGLYYYEANPYTERIPCV